MSNIFTKVKPTTPALNLPSPKTASSKLRTLGNLKLPVAKGPAVRGGCCGK